MSVSILRSPRSQTEVLIDLPSYSFHKELDSDKIKSHYKNDLNFCLNMFEVCLHSVPIAVADMHDAGEQKDYIAISTIANKLKSNFEIVGHSEMISILERIELCAKTKNNIVFELCFAFTSKVNSKLDIIRDEIFNISQFLKMSKLRYAG